MKQLALPMFVLCLTACPSVGVSGDDGSPDPPPVEAEVFAPGNLTVDITDLDLESGCQVDLDVTVTQNGKTATSNGAQFSNTPAGLATQFDLSNPQGVNFLAKITIIIKVTRIVGDCDPFNAVNQEFRFDGTISIGQHGEVSWTGNFAEVDDDDDD